MGIKKYNPTTPGLRGMTVSTFEEIFGVEVAKVNIMNYDGKLKRMGRFAGYTPSYKKAIVTLTPDSKEIEFFQGL